MKITLTHTDRVVSLDVDGDKIPAQVWEGQTADGARCAVFVTRIVCLDVGGVEAFRNALQETRAPSPEVAEFPVIMVL